MTTINRENYGLAYQQRRKRSWRLATLLGFIVALTIAFLLSTLWAVLASRLEAAEQYANQAAVAFFLIAMFYGGYAACLVNRARSFPVERVALAAIVFSFAVTVFQTAAEFDWTSAGLKIFLGMAAVFAGSWKAKKKIHHQASRYCPSRNFNRAAG